MKKEREFIISSEELKKNQERVLKAEAEARRIEEEEKREHQISVIAICFGIIFLIIAAIFIFDSGKKGVENCVNAGHTVNFCESAL
jgi:hypothetical protein